MDQGKKLLAFLLQAATNTFPFLHSISFGVCTSIECAEDTISSTMWNQCSELTNAYSFAKYLAGSNGPQYPEHVDGIEELREIINPYDYGYAFEVAVGEDGSYNANKWYAVGRRSNELAYILPDERTMYLSDDGTNVVFHMFIADEPKDFSSGTLYAAKFNQETVSLFIIFIFIFFLLTLLFFY